MSSMMETILWRLVNYLLGAEVESEGDGVITAVLAGSFPADAGRGSTAVDKLVAIGRGIGSEDNIELAQELAEAIGASVAASRPITDAGWLPKTRQVGKSGWPSSQSYTPCWVFPVRQSIWKG
ncbi:Electron transfer flavoprotein, alpha subunit [hydrothermal vent metagenome]|uniref:Electron transfer flavoprotein, alpha subunit n=1 Tax=hydrothermal vent metagenome TaxID=652676 RepID=A0A3B0V4E5_9ZZZZ